MREYRIELEIFKGNKMERIKLRAEHKKTTGYPVYVRDADGHIVWNSEYVHRIESEISRAKQTIEKYQSGIQEVIKQCDDNIFTLKDNFKNRHHSDHYPYAFDIKEQRVFKKKLQQLIKSLGVSDTGTKETPFVCPMCKHNQLKHLCTECEVQGK